MRRSVLVAMTLLWGLSIAEAKKTKIPAIVKPPQAMVGCKVADDCVMVFNGCDGCCEEASVRKDQQLAFSDYMKQQCFGFSGPACECVPADSSVACVKHSCKVVPEP
jgi:hypothetical protein